MSDKVHEALSKLIPRSTRLILEELEQLKFRADAGEKVTVPTVTLHLKSGKELVGWVLGLGDDKRGAKDAVLLHLHDPNSRAIHSDVAYVDLVNIEAVTVQNSLWVVPPLTKDWAGAPPNLVVPTRLELKRLVADLPAQLAEKTGLHFGVEVDWEHLPPDNQVFYWLDSVVNATAAALQEILSEDYAKEIMRPTLQKLYFSNAVEPAVALEGQTLTIKSDLTKGREGCLDKAALRKAIEDLF